MIYRDRPVRINRRSYPAVHNVKSRADRPRLLLPNAPRLLDRYTAPAYARRFLAARCRFIRLFVRSLLGDRDSVIGVSSATTRPRTARRARPRLGRVIERGKRPRPAYVRLLRV